LQISLHQKGLVSFGLDESRFMARQASKRLRKAGAALRLSRGLVQSLPYPAGSFDSVVATFPAEYIFDPRTLDELRRVIAPAGILVILPLAWITGIRPLERFIAWLMRISGEAPGQPTRLPAPVRELFTSRGFDLHQEIVSLPKSKVLVLLANAPHSRGFPQSTPS
jgi:SAM-dependent methyltransferase